MSVLPLATFSAPGVPLYGTGGGGNTYTAGSNLTLTGNTFAVSTNPSFSNINVGTVNNSAYPPPSSSYTAGSNLTLTGNTFAVSTNPSFSNATFTNVNVTTVNNSAYPPPSSSYTAGSNLTLTGNTFAVSTNPTFSNVNVTTVNNSAYPPPSNTYTAGSNMTLTGNSFAVSTNPTFSNINVTTINNSAYPPSGGGGVLYSKLIPDSSLPSGWPVSPGDNFPIVSLVSVTANKQYRVNVSNLYVVGNSSLLPLSVYINLGTEMIGLGTIQPDPAGTKMYSFSATFLAPITTGADIVVLNPSTNPVLNVRTSATTNFWLLEQFPTVS